MKQPEVVCKDVMEHICENLGEDLESPKCISIKTHLNGCSNCQHYFKSVNDTISFYKNYNVVLPEHSHSKLMSILGLDK